MSMDTSVLLISITVANSDQHVIPNYSLPTLTSAGPRQPPLHNNNISNIITNSHDMHASVRDTTPFVHASQ